MPETVVPIATIRPPVVPGQPVVAQVPASAMYVYDHIPQLRELLPLFRGWPGIYYLQVGVLGQSTAEADGWKEVANSVTYKIKGPEGVCDVKLYCMGDKVPGSCHLSGKRTCEVDLNIREITGLWEGAEEFRPKKSVETEGKDSKGK